MSVPAEPAPSQESEVGEPRRSAPSPRGAGRAPGIRNRAKLLLVFGLIAALALAHFTTSVHDATLHGLLFKATFLPLVLAGLWFGVRGAALASTLTIALYLVHILWQLAPHGHHELHVIVVDVALIVVMALTVGVLSDRREHALRDARGKAAALEETTRVLFQAETELRRADRLRSLGELAAGLAHEIRNPLGGIRGAGEILARDSTTTAARAEFRSVLLSEIDRLDRVVENFLRFARPGAAEHSEVDVALEAQATLLLLEGEASAANVRCRLEGAREARASTDPALLRQVLLNVCLNALQAMPDGGELVVTVRTGAAHAPLVVEVADTGTGIEPAIRERVFDPFVTTRESGTGLGLATAYRIMESLGGSIEILRTGTEGTTMRMTLPRD